MVEVGGNYTHFKEGKRYKVLYIAKNSETLEDMVIYQPQYGNRDIWVRPLSMWEESIPQDKITKYGQSVRFKKE
ncbi:DUF1653 domain-containing protein [Anaerospora hongkongensis]|uniref:DUF1653 domain-containing protein n=1 Tax=Anaerospora hongkongensis TaxID=244830 RepID=UPI002FD9957C